MEDVFKKQKGEKRTPFNMKITEEERRVSDKVAAYYGVTRADAYRIALKREYTVIIKGNK